MSAPFRSGGGEEVVEKTISQEQCALSRGKHKKQQGDIYRPTVVDAPPAYQEKDPAGVSKGLH